MVTGGFCVRPPSRSGPSPHGRHTRATHTPARGGHLSTSLTSLGDRSNGSRDGDTFENHCDSLFAGRFAVTARRLCRPARPAGSLDGKGITFTIAGDKGEV